MVKELRQTIQVLMKPIYIKIRLWILPLLILLAAVPMIILVLYNNLSLHNLFLKSLSTDQIACVSVYDYYMKDETALTHEEAEELLVLLNQIELNQEPYRHLGLMGSHGPFYHVQLKNGLEFNFEACQTDEGLFIFGEESYSIGQIQDPAAAEQNDLIQQIQQLHDAHMKKYYAYWFEQ